jgi:quinol monooxygenase YgiN
MSITVVLDVHMNPEAAAAARDGGYAETFKATRAFDGCKFITAYGVEGEPDRFVVLERWASKDHYQRYLAWRRETGYFEKTAGRMASPPVLRYLEEVA